MATDAEWEAFMARHGLPLRLPEDDPRIGVLAHHMRDQETIARARSDFMWQGAVEHLERTGEWPEIEGGKVVRRTRHARLLTRIGRRRLRRTAA